MRNKGTRTLEQYEKSKGEEVGGENLLSPETSSRRGGIAVEQDVGHDKEAGDLGGDGRLQDRQRLAQALNNLAVRKGRRT